MPMTDQFLIEFLESIGKIKSRNSEDPHRVINSPHSPDYIAIVHLKSIMAWDIQIVHAHFDFKNSGFSGSRNEFAIKILEEKLIADNSGSWTFNYENATYKPYTTSTGEIAQYYWFSKFGFGSPHNIYFYFEDASGGVEVRFLQNFIFLFTDKFQGGSKVDDNHAFFNGRNITSTISNSSPIKNRGKLLFLENRFTKNPSHDLIDPTQELLSYKLNIAYFPNGRVPILVDPDTGNGMGHEP